MDVIQWCDDVEQVHTIIEMERNLTNAELLDLGCHWVPPSLPAEAEILEIVETYVINFRFWNLVRIRIEGTTKDAFTLVAQ
jgi:hypothetical protein